MGNVLRRNNICGNGKAVNEKTPSETSSTHDKITEDHSNSILLTKEKFEPVENIILSNEEICRNDNNVKTSGQNGTSGDVTWRKLNSNEVENTSPSDKDEIELYESSELIISLLPHQHTLFCERKQRVCTAVGKLQELEYVAVSTRSGEPMSIYSFCWIRLKSSQPDATFEIIPDSENCESYQLQREDVGHWISICYTNFDDSIQDTVTPIPVSSSQPETFTLRVDEAKADDAGDKKEGCKSEDVPEDVKVDETETIPLIEGSGDAPTDTSESKSTTPDASASPDVSTLVSEKESKVAASNESSASLNSAAIPSSVPVEGDNEVPISTVETASITTDNAPTNAGTATATISSVDAITPPPVSDPVVSAPLKFLSRKLGPVLAGPPRLLDMTVQLEAIPIPPDLSTVEVDGSTLQVAVARSEYIGGVEGQSEYWWFRISPDGRREQVTEPIAVSSPTLIGESLAWGDYNSKDPRFYRITEADLGCTLKAKCRPVRCDNFKGEIFTSKSSAVIGDRGHS
eukprot:gene22388-30639_t